MRSVSRRPGPGLARSDRGRRGPFADLLARAGEDGAAAEGLALAYGDLPRDQRRALLHVTLRDAKLAGTDLLEPLLAMLSVEEDVSLAREIARSIHGEVGDELRRQADLPKGAGHGWAMMGREGPRTTAVISRRRAEPLDTLCVTWSRERVERIALDALEDPDAARDRYGEHLRDAPLGLTVDTIAPVLWRHRRHGGSFPNGAERFAELF